MKAINWEMKSCQFTPNVFGDLADNSAVGCQYDKFSHFFVLKVKNGGGLPRRPQVVDYIPLFPRKIAMNTTPSASAAKIIAAVRMGPEAPGLRPVASAAFAPTKPTPIAEPSAAKTNMYTTT